VYTYPCVRAEPFLDDLQGTRNHPLHLRVHCLEPFANEVDVDLSAKGSAGRTTTSQQFPLADSFYNALLSGQATTLGQALQQAKMAAAENPELIDVIHTFNLLGDPALRFHRPATPTSSP